MKFIKAIALTGMFVFGTQCAFTRPYEITRSNGGPNGYNSVHEWHGTYRSTLDCSDPGYSTCEWLLDPAKMPKLMGYADGQISNGVYTGTHTEIIGSLKCIVTWEANSTGYAHIFETDDDISSLD